jgi:ubiquitin-activating enzyme E1
VKESREIFNTFYDHSIRDILGVFPENHVDTSGQPFWSGPKRCPTPLTFNPEDDTHINFIWACSNLIFDTLGVFKIDRATAKLIVSQIPPAEYVRKIVHVETPEEAKEREAAGRPPPEMNASSDDDEPAIAQLLQSLEGKTRDLDAESFKPADFEKDDDTNFHIDFITACSNLRARNYKITEADRNKTKMIAGKIIPAIATTTAMITGVVSNEIYKYTQGFDDVTKFKNSFCNLSLPSLMFTQPDDVKKLFSKELDIDMGGPCTRLPEGYTGYDKTVLSVGSLTIQGLFDWLRENKGVECYSLDSGEEVVLYN